MGNDRWMKRLMVLVVSGALMVALTATVASAQPYKAEEIEVTGVLEAGSPPYGPEGFLQYFINDEQTGAERPLLECGRGSVNNLEDFVGQRVTVTGIPQTQGNPPSSFSNPNEIPMCVDGIEPAGQENDNGEEPEVQPQCFLPEGCFLSGDGSSETIFGGIGPDYIIGGYGHDRLEGQSGGDWLDGGAGDDLVLGQGGDDLVDGGSGNDHVRGGGGSDYVTGFIGNDALFGNGGDDFIYAADGWFDRVLGNESYDVCVVDWFDLVDLCEEVYYR